MYVTLLAATSVQSAFIAEKSSTRSLDMTTDFKLTLPWWLPKHWRSLHKHHNVQVSLGTRIQTSVTTYMLCLVIAVKGLWN